MKALAILAGLAAFLTVTEAQASNNVVAVGVPSVAVAVNPFFVGVSPNVVVSRGFVGVNSFAAVNVGSNVVVQSGRRNVVRAGSVGGTTIVQNGRRNVIRR